MASCLLGIIADTHGLLRPEAVAALRGAGLILHAGDIGTAAVLDQLRQVAPVKAVRGNIDREAWAAALPRRGLVEAAGTRLYLLHVLADLDVNPAAAGVRVVISGHTHRPALHEHEGVLYLNPGGAGPRRFRLPVTIARLRVGNGVVEGEIIHLPVG